jgi:hypothetical protein
MFIFSRNDLYKKYVTYIIHIPGNRITLQLIVLNIFGLLWWRLILVASLLSFSLRVVYPWFVTSSDGSKKVVDFLTLGPGPCECVDTHLHNLFRVLTNITPSAFTLLKYDCLWIEPALISITAILSKTVGDLPKLVETAHLSDMSVNISQTTWHHITEDSNLRMYFSLQYASSYCLGYPITEQVLRGLSRK